MKIEYCESCKKRLTQHDVENGQATWIGNLIYCKKCIKTKEINAPNPNINVSAHRMPSPVGLRALAHNSGLLNVSSGGVRKKGGSSTTNSRVRRTGSGLHQRPSASKHRRKSPSGAHSVKKKSQGSGIRRARSESGASLKAGSEVNKKVKLKPGSGIQATPGSGVQASPGSGIRAKPGSGIHPKSPKKSGIRKQRSPGSGIRAKSPANSGLRAGKNPGSGIRTVPAGSKPGVKRSGIHSGNESKRSIHKAEARSHGGHGRRGRGRRSRSDDTTMISIIGVLVGVSVGAIIFFSIIS